MSDTKFVVEHGIPVPEPASGSGTKYPWCNLQSGDSFLVPCEPDDFNRIANNVRTCGKIILNRRGMILVSRKVEGGLRVWAISGNGTGAP